MINNNCTSSSIIDTAMMSVNVLQTEMTISTQNEYQKEFFRVLSFLSWKTEHVSIENLARFGFYYSSDSDYVTCYCCQVEIGKWGIGDDALTEHHKHSPECNFINLRDQNNVPNGNGNELENKLKAFIDAVNSKQPIPKHPLFKDESARFQSFSDWPKSIKQTPEELVKAGFFYLGTGDQVKCFCCGGCLKQWEITDSAIEEHKKFYFHNCPFIQDTYEKLKNIIAKHETTKPLVNATSEQIEKLTDFMNNHSDLRDGVINFRRKEVFNKLWNEITEILNCLNGPKKDANAWREVWKNKKFNNKRKRNPPLSPQVERSSQDYKVPPDKKLKICQNNEDSNTSLNNETRQMVLYDNNTTSGEQGFSSVTSSTVSNNTNLEFENKELKLKIERLQLDLDKSKFEKENAIKNSEFEIKDLKLQNGNLQLELNTTKFERDKLLQEQLHLI